MKLSPEFNAILAEALERYHAGKEAYLKANPPTNADRIRAMSDEELAYLLVHNPWMREESALDWLQSPADGGDGDA